MRWIFGRSSAPVNAAHSSRPGSRAFINFTPSNVAFQNPACRAGTASDVIVRGRDDQSSAKYGARHWARSGRLAERRRVGRRTGSSARPLYTSRTSSRRRVVFVANEACGAFVSGNSTLIVVDSAALVVDTGNYPELTRSMSTRFGRSQTGSLSATSHTRWHPDHWLGNAAYLGASRRGNRQHGIHTRGDSPPRSGVPHAVSGHGRDVGAARRLLAPGESKDRRAATTPELLRSLASRRNRRRPRWLSATIEAPTLTFDRALHVHLGNRDVDIRFLGRGNTRRRRCLRHRRRARSSPATSSSLRFARIRLLLSRFDRVLGELRHEPGNDCPGPRRAST